jgi:hypothetical protein
LHLCFYPFIHPFLYLGILRKIKTVMLSTEPERILILKVEKKCSTSFVELITAVNCETAWEGQLEAIITGLSSPWVNTCCVHSKMGGGKVVSHPCFWFRGAGSSYGWGVYRNHPLEERERTPYC